MNNPDPAKFGPFVQDHHLEIRDMMMRFAEDRLAPGAQERELVGEPGAPQADPIVDPARIGSHLRTDVLIQDGPLPLGGTVEPDAT